MHAEGAGFGLMMGVPSLRGSLTRGAGIAVALIALTGPALADEVYTYRIEHPTFGEIGRYTDTISRNGDEQQIVSRLRVAVKVLGIVLHREEADRTEIWRAGRLVKFQSVTISNGDRFEVQGEAREDGFAVTTASGVKLAPPDVMPSNPWSAKAVASGIMMSTKTGRLELVHDIHVEDAVIPVRGVETHTRHYVIMTDKRQDVWKDEHGVPVQFRTAEPVGSIEFILVDDARAAGPAQARGGTAGAIAGSHR
jgi:hypothetical protein